ncbi:MAG: diguanylate cyclase [Pseudomonadota bacterium]
MAHTTQDGTTGAAHRHSETLYQSATTRVVRIGAGDGLGSQIIKQPVGVGAGERLQREKAILDRLVGVHGVITPVTDDPSTLIFDDPGCTALAALIQERSRDSGEVLRLGLALARILAEVHQRGIIHKDINPANIIVGSGPLEVFLIDFDIASPFDEERSTFSALSEISGTLPYMAPEQTGRNARPLDRRADFYSLGATLYAALTGKPPFGSDDPLQIVHDHLARIPEALAVLDPCVPQSLSRIVARLMEKEPDDRYQSAEGLVFDLAKSYERWVDGNDAAFELGERDFSARLRPPSRLLGRESELAALRRWFDELSLGNRATVLVSGVAGVGKSALLDEVRAWVTPAGGLFAAARFEPYRQGGENDAVRQALRGLVRVLLAEPETQLVALRERLRAELGTNAALAAAALPEIAHLLQIDGEVDVSDARSVTARLRQITQQLLRSIASADRPVVLVIDDLQWASGAALDALDSIHLDAELHGVLILASYRNTEVDAAHSLRALIARWQHLGVAPRELQLDNLDDDAIAALLGESLRLPEVRALALAGSVRSLANGNPFDTLELIDALRRDGILRLAPDGWQWDGDRIHGFLEGRNVGALVAQRLDSLAPATAALLDTMSCLGGAVPLGRLGVAAGMTPEALAPCIKQAMNEGLLVMDRASDSVRFRHERIQQAVMACHDAATRMSLLLTVARRLSAVPEQAQFAAEPYLQVVDEIEDDAEIARIVGLFRVAATHGRLNASWPQTERYTHAALSLLVRHPRAVSDDAALLDLQLRLATDRHAALYGLGRFADADEVYGEIVARGTDPLHVAEATWTQISSLTQRGRPGDAVALALDLLGKLNLDVPATPEALHASIGEGMTHMYAWLRDTKESDDIARPEDTDARAIAISRTINRSIPAAYFSDQQVMAWLITQAARRWREHGPAAALVGPLSHAAFVTIALREDYRGGHDIVRRVLNVAQARRYELDRAQAGFAYALSGSHWMHPLEEGVAEARSSREKLLRGGEPHLASVVYYSLLPSLTDCARTLGELETEATAAVVYCQRIGNDQAAEAFIAYRQLARCLSGNTVAQGSFDDGSFDEQAHLQRLAANPVGAVNYRVTRALGALLSGELDLFVERIGTTMPSIPFRHATYLLATMRVLYGLALAYRARRAPPAERPALLGELDGIREWLAKRSEDSPHNFQHLLHLFDGERAWVVNDFCAAAQAYDVAYRVASTRCRPWHRGLILEQAARFHAAFGIEGTASMLMQRARKEYDAWGAHGKTAAMGAAEEGTSPDTQADGPRTFGSHRSGSMRGEEIDLLGILKAAQQLQTETDPDRLIDSVSTVLSALSGATSVRLAWWGAESKDWFVSAISADGVRREIAFEQAVAEWLLPSTAFRYVQRTREPLVVDDALSDDRFLRDPYFKGLQRCSLLVVPVLSRGALKAMLVLENRVAQAVFSAQRLDGVMLIAGQLATSLDNALLSESIERRVAQNESLIRLSNTDSLTGLANRRRLDATLAEMLKSAAQRQEPIAAAMIDIDCFKKYNDLYGHQTGDECLARVAAAIHDCARTTDLVARYGGEEFVILLPGTDLAAARQVVERVRANVAALAVPHADSSYGIVTLSLGVASLVPARDDTATDAAERLLRIADEALYEAKQAGRNRVMPG